MIPKKNEEDFSCIYPKHYCELREKKKFQETFSQKALKPLKNMFLISQKNYRSYWYLRTTGNIQLEINKQKQSAHWYIIHPFSMLRFCWEIIMIAVLAFSIIFFPFKTGFLNPLTTKYYISMNRSVENAFISIFISLGLDIVWLTDLLGNLITGYYDHITGKIVMNPKAILRQFGTYRFVLDATTCLPIEPFILIAFGMETLANMSHFGFTCLQLYYFYSLIRFRHYLRYCYKLGSLGNVTYLTFRIIFAIVVYFCIINWTIYVSLVVPQVAFGEKVFMKREKDPLSWTQVLDLFNRTLWSQYKTVVIKSVFTNIGVATWNNMFTVDDYILAVMICICNRIYFIYFIVWFLEAVTAANALRVKFRLILEQLKTYMKKKEVPIFLKKRLNRFYYYRFQAHYFRDRAILARLNPSLRKEISMFTCQKLIHNTEVFQSLPRRVVARLVQRMHREMYFPQDVIVRANTYGECMYFICSGTVAVWTASDKEICRLEDGEFFGEIALIVEDRRRTATVTAVTITEVYRLEASDYKKIIQLYPDVYNRLEKYAAVRFKMLMTMEGKIGN